MSTEAREVEVGLLVHGITELHARHLLLQKVFHICGIGFLDIKRCDQTRLNRHVLQALGCSRTGHDHLFHPYGFLFPSVIGRVGGGSGFVEPALGSLCKDCNRT